MTKLFAIIAMVASVVGTSSRPVVARACGEGVGVPLATTPASRLQLSSDPTAPLLVVFHGKNGCIASVQEQTQLDENQRGASVLWLTGTGGVWDGWYENANRTYTYISASIAEARNAGANPRVTVAVGISMGAVMAMWAACTLPEFDAVVTIAGTARLAKCNHRGLSLFVIGGGADGSTNPPGSQMPPALGDRWRELSVSCGDSVESGSNGVLDVLRGCANGTLVREVTLAGVGHVWPLLPQFNADAEIILFANTVGFVLPGPA